MSGMNFIKVKTFTFIGLLVVVIIVIGIYMINRLSETDDDARSTNTNKAASFDNFLITDEGLPVYPSAEEMLNFEESGEVRSFQLEPGTTPAELMIFYEEWLVENDWQLLIRDRDDGQIDALNKDGEKMRVWVYFTGSVEENIGMTFFLNYSPAGGGSLPLIPVN